MTEPFLSRWSKRKQALAKGFPDEESAKIPAKAAALSNPASMPGVHPPSQEVVVGDHDHTETPGRPIADAQNPSAPALPTLDDARALTTSSDFQPFMQQGVATDVRNAAVKKLFTDPHFNVMDGLDIYIDDYNTPDPLPAGMLQKMVGAQFLNLFPETNAEQAVVSDQAPAPKSESLQSGVNPHQSPALPESLPDVAQSPQLPNNNNLQHNPMPQVPALTQHDDPDLQLQPNHAPANPSSGPSTG